MAQGGDDSPPQASTFPVSHSGRQSAQVWDWTVSASLSCIRVQPLPLKANTHHAPQ